MSDTLEQWLSDHALTRTMLEAWSVVVDERFMLIPVFSVTGKRAFILKRNFYGEQKYQVDPDGARRGYQLYGLWKSLKTIMNLGTALVVEGFSDCIALHDNFPGTVAMLGSKITDVQRNTLKCFCDQIVLWSDGDETGENSAQNTESNDNLLVTAFTVEGLDPAEFIAAGYDIQDTFYVARKHSKKYRYLKFSPQGKILEALERDPEEIERYLVARRRS